jgi:hypothetical protein
MEKITRNFKYLVSFYPLFKPVQRGPKFALENKEWGRHQINKGGINQLNSNRSGVDGAGTLWSQQKKLRLLTELDIKRV